MPKVSVIVPVYNTEKYLPRCINSILDQTFTDFELILVDDGSTDNSGKICDEYSKKDSRIVVIHKENGGASSARNTGIDIAKGEWISFVDSDDWVNVEYLNGLIIDASKDDNVDFVIQGLFKVVGNFRERLSLKEYQIYARSELEKLWSDVNIFRHCGSYCKIFRLNLLNKYNIRYNTQIICAEDYEFILNYFLVCSKIVVSNNANYFYDNRINSLSTKIYCFERELNGLELLNKAYLKIIKLDPLAKSILIQYNKLITYYTHRVLLSIYSNNVSKVKNRLLKLEKIDNYYIFLYQKHHKPKTTFLKFVKYLFTNKYNRLLDIVLYIRLRYEKNI